MRAMLLSHLSRTLSFLVPSSVSLSNSLGDLILLRGIDVAPVDPLQQPFLHDLTYNLFFNLLGVNLGSAEQRTKAGLMLYMPCLRCAP